MLRMPLSGIARKGKTKKGIRGRDADCICGSQSDHSPSLRYAWGVALPKGADAPKNKVVSGELNGLFRCVKRTFYVHFKSIKRII